MLCAVVRRIWIIGLVVLALIAPPLAAQAPLQSDAITPQPPGIREDPFFGIVQAKDAPEMAVAAGVTWERLLVWWSALQPNGPTRPTRWRCASQATSRRPSTFGVARPRRSRPLRMAPFT